MTDRHRRILASLVAEYIEQGEPVSSAWLADHSALGLSSATVRNILASARGAGTRAAAAYVGGPHPDRFRLPAVRRHAARVAPQSPGRSPRSRRGCDASATVERPARTRVAGAVARVAADRLRDRARRTRRSGCSTSTSSVLEGSRVLVIVVGDRRPRHAQGHRDGRAATARPRSRRPPTTSTASSPA